MIILISRQTTYCDIVDTDVVDMDMVDMDMMDMDMMDTEIFGQFHIFGKFAKDHLADLSRLLGLVIW